MTKKSPPKLDKTTEKILTRFRLLTLNFLFDKKITDLRKKYRVPQTGFKNDRDNEYKTWLPKFHHVGYVQELSYLRQKCMGYAPIYQDLFEYYFLFGQIKQESKISVASFENIFSLKAQSIEPDYFIRIYPDTGREDVIQAYKDFRKHLKKMNKMPPKYHPNKFLDRDIKIIQLARSGYVEYEIEDVINRQFPKQKIKKGTKNTVSVPDRIRSLEKQILNLYLGD